MMSRPTMQESDRVKITKVKSHFNENAYIHDGYWVRGFLTKPVQVGHPILLWRIERNGEKVSGVFTTSPVQMISSVTPPVWVIETENSTFTVEWEGEGCEQA